MKKIVGFILILILGVFGFAALKLAQDGFDIQIDNDTNQEISGLNITYDHIKSDIYMPTVEPGESYSLHIDPEEDSDEQFSEAALKLEYEDENGILHTEYVIGYFEAGYSGKAVIDIQSVDDNGKLEVVIESDTSLY